MYCFIQDVYYVVQKEVEQNTFFQLFLSSIYILYIHIEQNILNGFRVFIVY